MFSHLTNYMGYGSSPDALEPVAILLELKTGVENCSHPLEPLDKFLQNFVQCQLQMLCPMLILYILQTALREKSPYSEFFSHSN